MHKVVKLKVLLLVALLLAAACSGDPAPESDSVQVENGDASILTAQIPGSYTTANEALVEGTRLFDAGETENAINVLLDAVKLDPDLAEAHFKLGVAYSLVEADLRSAELDGAVNVSENSAATKPGTKKNSERAFENAVTAYKKILAENRDDDNAHFYLGLTYNKLNEDQDAARSLKEAVRLKPDNTEYQTELGAILIKLAKYHEAVAALKKAVELDPTNIDAEELLERAEAGRKRIDFIPPKKDDKQANSNSNANVTTNSGTPPISGTNRPQTGAPNPPRGNTSVPKRPN